MSYVIGTAGHVDHGKSTLVAALTGMRADRLGEEQRREMTIDLGFTWFTLPSGRTASLVDVPGHERFIKNMLAGVGGLDAALLVVAADEGVMPQTTEHLHILDLLEIEQGLVVLTKRDAVDDEWFQLVEEDVRAKLAETRWAAAPMVAVSARTGVGLDELQQQLDALLGALPGRNEGRGVPRLPVDRVFTVGGFGTVVTGTLLDGPLAVGQEVELAPGGVQARIRGLQSRHSKTDEALPGTRVAANLSGVAVEHIRRGDVLTLPDALTPTTLIDLQLRLTADAPLLEHNTPLDLFVGAAEVGCHVALLNRETLGPGEQGWVQLRLDAPIAATRGDRCIVRIPSPSQTIGGGRVIDAHPPRHRRFRADTITTLETLARGTPEELVAQALASGGPYTVDEVVQRSSLDSATVTAALATLIDSDGAIALEGSHSGSTPQMYGGPSVAAPLLIMGTAAWAKLADELTKTLQAYHKSHPLRLGMARESLRQKLGVTNARSFNAVLAYAAHSGAVVLTPTLAHVPNWLPQLTPQQERQVAALLNAFATAPFSPPSRADWDALDPDLLALLIDNGQLVRVSPDVLFGSDAYVKLVEWTQATLATEGEVTVAGLRDAFNTSRKYALAFLEHLDERKITRRAGEARTRY